MSNTTNFCFFLNHICGWLRTLAGVVTVVYLYLDNLIRCDIAARCWKTMIPSRERTREDMEACRTPSRTRRSDSALSGRWGVGVGVGMKEVGAVGKEVGDGGKEIGAGVWGVRKLCKLCEWRELVCRSGAGVLIVQIVHDLVCTYAEMSENLVHLTNYPYYIKYWKQDYLLQRIFPWSFFFLRICIMSYVPVVLWASARGRLGRKHFFVNSVTLGVQIWRNKHVNYNKLKIATKQRKSNI